MLCTSWWRRGHLYSRANSMDAHHIAMPAPPFNKEVGWSPQPAHADCRDAMLAIGALTALPWLCMSCLLCAAIQNPQDRLLLIEALVHT